VENQGWSQAHTLHLLVPLLLHSENVSFTGDELFVEIVSNPARVQDVQITDFNILLNLFYCSHFLIKGKPMSLCYLPVKKCSWPLCFVILIILSFHLFLHLSLSIIYNTHHCYGTYSKYLHPRSIFYSCSSFF